MKPRVIVIVGYDPGWPQRFESEAATFRTAIPAAVAIDHVGSTAVPGLDAKPTIDIQLSVTDLSDRSSYEPQLQSLGYVLFPDDEPEHEFFRRPDPLPRDFHVHVCEMGGDWSRRHIGFRDHLRANPEDAVAYAALKRRLARLHRHDGEAYSEAKTDFIRAIEAKAGLI
jgi:GrpB-like predicted nucleotidyltransferase (UPF0157 family)